MRKKLTLKRSHWFLAIILSLAFAARLYRLTYPLLDWHSFRQADTASVTREFVKHHYPIWRPHYHDLGDIQSGLDNLAGDRMVEFPLVNYLLACWLRVFPTWDLVVTSRLAAALASTGSCWCLYWLVKKLSSGTNDNESQVEWVAQLSALTLAILPYSIYYGRAILPEPFQVFFGLLALVGFISYLQERHWSSWGLTAVSLLVALLIKPTTIFWGPLFLLLAWQKDGWRCFKRGDLWLLALVAILPLGWWRLYIRQFPAGIPANSWLFNGPINGVAPRWRPMWWRWLFYERLTKDWLGWLGVIWILLGLCPLSLSRRKTQLIWRQADIFVYCWLITDFVYLSVFARGNIQHDYYQYLLLPVVAMLVGRGLVAFASWVQCFLPWRSLVIALTVVVSATAWCLAWERVGGYFNVNNWAQVRIGHQADLLLPSDALVIAHAYDADTSFLFQTNRCGWSTGLELEDKIAKGAHFFVGTDTDDLYHHLLDNYQLLAQNEDGFIFDLTASSEGQLSASASGQERQP